MDNDTQAPTERFWRHIPPGGADDCWEWRGVISTSGYGKFGRDYAHRISYVFHHGQLPPGHVVRHSCDNPLCCNPAHLLAGTHADNVHDMLRRRRNNQPHGETHQWARLTDAQVEEIRNRLRAGEPATNIAPEFGVTHRHIRRIGRGAARRTPAAVNL